MQGKKTERSGRYEKKELILREEDRGGKIKRRMIMRKREV